MLLSGRDRDSPSPWRHRGSLLACLFVGLLCGWQLSMRSCVDQGATRFPTGAGPPLPAPSPPPLLTILDPAVHPQGNLIRVPAPLRSQSLTHLVMIAGHGVHLGVDFTTLRTNDAAWSLEPYQRANGQTGAFVKHIEKAVQIAGQDAKALLIFSGGETRAVSDQKAASLVALCRRDSTLIRFHADSLYLLCRCLSLQSAGPLNIASTNWMIAERLRWFGFPAARDRSTTEPLSRDSYENLLWSICRFYEMTGAYPQRITVVGFEFKRARFESMHRAAIRFPAAAFTYVGIDHPDPSAALKGELAKSITPFRLDPYGCGPEMVAKKNERNPFARSMFGWLQSCPQLAELFLFCGPQQFDAPLPWD